MSRIEQSTILIVDDEEVMRDVVSLIVEDAGGIPLLAADGPEGLSLLQESGGGVGCVVIDFSMPGLNGFDTWSEMTRLQAPLPTVFISGLKASAEVEALHRERKVEFVSKPFTAETLLGAIERAMAASSAVE